LNKAQVLNLSLLNIKTVNRSLKLYEKYRKTQSQTYVDQIIQIFEIEYSQPESHTHLQLAKAYT